jgi:hypothetical protein
MTLPFRVPPQSDADAAPSTFPDLGTELTITSDRRATLDAMERVFEALSAFDLEEQLFVLELSWMAIASHARNGMLSTTRGFSQEQHRQVAVLDGMRALVQADTPDLDLERLWRERDIEGIIRYCHDRSAGEAGCSNRLLRIGYLIASLGRLRDQPSE